MRATVDNVAGRSPAKRKPLAFRTERALIEMLAGADLLDASYDRAYSRREVPVGGCIPDLVYVRFSGDPAAAVLPRRFSFRHAFVLWLLRERSPLQLATIAARCFERPEKTWPVVATLLRAGAVAQAATGAFLLTAALRAVSAEVIAIEAKLTRWRDALEQATSYQRFADRVIVAMDRHGLPPPAAHAEFVRRGIGLCAVDRDGSSWIVGSRVMPRARGPEWEYLVRTAPLVSTQTLWSSR